MATDPLVGLPEQERVLFEAFNNASRGRSYDAVLGAAINVIINAVRQIEAERSKAEARYNELFGKGKTILLDKHYDSVTGKRRNVFPHTQVVKMQYHHEDDDLMRG